MKRDDEIKVWAHNQIDPEFIDESYWQGLQDGARWADRTMLDKACEWLKSFLEGLYRRIFSGKRTRSYKERMP